MLIRRSLSAAIVLLLFLGFALEARAEVAVETDAYGNYVRTTILANASVRQLRVWRVRRHGWGVHPLNPDGDRNGDLWPTVGENPANRRYPWVIWSRFNGYNYDLAWARWKRGSWTPIQWVSDTTTPGDDLNPSLTFDMTGRPYTAWWRDEGGVGRIYMSFFLVTHWMPPLMLSDLGIDSRNPQIVVLSDGSLEVQYRTPTGNEVRLVSFNDSTTITDDLNPVGSLSVARIPYREP